MLRSVRFRSAAARRDRDPWPPPDPLARRQRMAAVRSPARRQHRTQCAEFRPLYCESLRLAVIQRVDRDVADAGSGIKAWRYPRPKNLEALIARGDEYAPVRQRRLDLDRVQKIGDDPSLVLLDSVDPINKKDRRPARA